MLALVLSLCACGAHDEPVRAVRLDLAQASIAPAARPDDLAAIELDGLVLLAGATRLATAPLPHAGAWIVEGRWSAPDLRPGVDALLLTAVELEDPRPPDDPVLAAQGAYRIVARERIERAGRDEPFRLAFVVDASSRALGLAGAVMHGAAPQGVVGARVTNLSARPARAMDMLASSPKALEPEQLGGLVRARFELAGTLRPGIAIGLGDAATLTLPPEPSGALELWCGLLPVPGFHPSGDALISARLADGREVRLEVPARDGRSARWHRLLVPLEGRAASAVTLGATGDAQGVVAVFAGARVAPPAASRARADLNVLNVVIVSIDTLRRDRLGCYGYERDTTPRLDALAADALVFDDVWSTAPYTLPAHASLLSGQLPSVHGVQNVGHRISGDRTTMLAEILASRGYATAAFTGGVFVGPEFGFARGFDRFGRVDPFLNLESSRARDLVADGIALDEDVALECGVPEMLAWLDGHADEPFLLFVHTYVVHEFDPPAAACEALGLRHSDLAGDAEALEHLGLTAAPTFPADPEVVRRLSDRYDAAIRAADDGVGRVLARLDALGLRDHTVIVVTSDHGKELGERGLVAHGHSLHEEMLQVPLIVRIPGEPPRRVATPVSLVDVVPTVLEILDLPHPPAIQGKSLLAATARTLVAEVESVAHMHALRDGDLKTIESPRDVVAEIVLDVPELSFDLADDPGERRPLPFDQRRMERVRDTVDELRALGESLGAQGSLELDTRALAALRKLGY